MPSKEKILQSLWPRPRKLHVGKGPVLTIGHARPSVTSKNWPSAKSLANELFSRRIDGKRRANAKGEIADGSLKFHIEKTATGHGPQWYKLTARREYILIEASDLPGVRYGCETLLQLIVGCDGSIPRLTIEDWPDFAVRGVMLDISRDKVPTIETIEQLIDMFAAWKLNQLQLYMEHTFQYPGHEKVWRGSGALSAKDVRRLDRYCADRGIELVPNQNSLGHMERWLKHEPYRQLAETLEPWDTPWGYKRNEPTTLCPIDKGSLALVKDLYEALLPNFESRLFNIGCDEPWELGQGRSKNACEKIGQGRVYLDYLTKLHKVVRRYKRRMQFWGDWLLKYPELVPELPQDIMPLVWGYEADHPYNEQCGHVARSGLEFYVCPGTSAWCSIAGRTGNMFDNIRKAAASGRKHGATGILVTDWGDYGHRQVLPVSYAGFVWTAGQGWCAKTNRETDVESALDRSAFGGQAGIGQLWLEAGRVYEGRGAHLPNRSPLFQAMDYKLDDPVAIKGLTNEDVDAMSASIRELRKKAKKLRIRDSLVHGEFELTLQAMEHACKRAKAALRVQNGKKPGIRISALVKDLKSIIDRHQKIWLQRNRRGGLTNSVRWYRKVLKEYQEVGA